MNAERPSTPADATTVVAPLTVGHGGSIGAYRLVQRLGEGGMGEVWLAEQTRPIHRHVAVKLIKLGMDSAQVIARFEAERRALALMDHPAIATVFDGGTTTEGRLYFAMEYVKGEPIITYCERHKLPLGERLALFVQVCQGVQHAHQKGIIHRDLKPSNVLITLVDGRPVPKIIDFGVARATARHLTDQSMFTELGAMVGTPEYMSPEQAEMGGLDIDTRTDVYALGVLLYELLTGSLPFDSRTLRDKGLDEIRRVIREVDPPKPSARVTETGAVAGSVPDSRRTGSERWGTSLRGDLDWITMKALEKDRTRRYDTVMALSNDILHHLAHEPVSAGPPSAGYRTRKFVRRHRFGVAAASTLILVLLASGLMMASQARRIAQERDRANLEAIASQQVSDFLVGLFRVSDPSEARGRTLTALEILNKGAAQLQSSLQDQPQVRARLLSTVGSVFTALGLHREAEPLLKQAFDTQVQIRGADSVETLRAANDLATGYFYLASYEEANRLYADLVRRRTQQLGENHPDTLKAAFDLASTFLAKGDWGPFESLARDTLAKQRQVLGNAHRDTLSSLNNLQNFYFRRGRHSEAEPIAVEVFEARRRLLGDEHPDTLRAAHNVATIYDALGRDAEAEPLYLKTLEIKRRVIGPEHPQTSITLSRLASLYAKQRRYEEAESAALAAYRGYSNRLGENSSSAQDVAAQLAALYRASGRTSEAARWQARLPAPIQSGR